MGLKLSHLPKNIQAQVAAMASPTTDLITFSVPLPPSVNKLYATDWRTKRRFKTEDYEDWLRAADAAVNRAIETRSAHIAGRFHAGYRIARFPDRRRRDLANYEKALTDFIVKRRFVEDDSLMQTLSLRWDDELEVGTAHITLKGA